MSDMVHLRDRHDRWALLGIFALLALAPLALLMPARAQGPPIYLRIAQVNTRGWPNVSLMLTVTGPDGQPVAPLTADQLTVREADQPPAQAVLNLGRGRPVPLVLVFAIDTGAGMAGEKLTQAKTAAGTFLQRLRPEDQGALLAFGDGVRLVVPFTHESGPLQVGLAGLQAGGQRYAYDALVEAADLLRPATTGPRRVIVLLTDGADTRSVQRRAAASLAARQAGALVFIIGLGPAVPAAVLQSLSEPTGGQYYPAPSPADLPAVYAAFARDLDAQTVLRYRSAVQPAQSFQFVTLQVAYRGAAGEVVTQTARYVPPAPAGPPRTFAHLPGPAAGDAPPATPPVPAGPPTPAPLRPGSRLQDGLAGTSLVVLALLLLVAGLAAARRPGLAIRRLQLYIAESVLSNSGPGASPTTGAAGRTLLPLFNRLGRPLLAHAPRAYRALLVRRTLHLGPPHALEPGGLLAIQALLAALCALPILALGAATASGDLLKLLGMPLLGSMIGLYVPYFLVVRRVGVRRQRLLHALPDALDFLAVNVEAGVTFDSALAQIVQRWRNPLTAEFALLLIDFQVGLPRRQAWQGLIARTQVPDLTAFLTAVAQMEQVGGSVGRLLRSQAEEMRVRRRQRAEEQAGAAPIKMLLPMVFFTFPGILAVLLCPALLRIMAAFGGGLP